VSSAHPAYSGVLDLPPPPITFHERCPRCKARDAARNVTTPLAFHQLWSPLAHLSVRSITVRGDGTCRSEPHAHGNERPVAFPPSPSRGSRASPQRAPLHSVPWQQSAAMSWAHQQQELGTYQPIMPTTIRSEASASAERLCLGVARRGAADAESAWRPCTLPRGKSSGPEHLSRELPCRESCPEKRPRTPLESRRLRRVPQEAWMARDRPQPVGQGFNRCRVSSRESRPS